MGSMEPGLLSSAMWTLPVVAWSLLLEGDFSFDMVDQSNYVDFEI
jgi:hypothetical protein